MMQVIEATADTFDGIRLSGGFSRFRQQDAFAQYLEKEGELIPID